MMPLTLTLLTAAVPAAKRGMMHFGIWGAVNGLAVASGPLIGGSLTEHVSWHWIFWLNVPLGLVAASAGPAAAWPSRTAPVPRSTSSAPLLASGGLFGIVLRADPRQPRRLDQHRPCSPG